MNRRIAFLVALLTATPILAGAEKVALRPLVPASEPVLRLVGGESAEVSFDATVPPGKRTEFRVRLYQLTGALAAPLGAARELGAADADGTLTASLPTPTVKVPTEVIAKIDARTAADGRVVPAGQFRLVLYPRDAIAALGRFAQRIRDEAGLRLGVFGKSDALRAVLADQRVDFRDLGARPPQAATEKLLLLGDAPPTEVEALRRGNARRLLVFTDDPSLAPGVYAHIAPESAFAKITLPLLDTLATDPQSLHTFLEILHAFYLNSTTHDPQ